MDCFNMYEERSFLRDKSMLRYVIQLLESLNDFDIVLERSLVSGVEWPLMASHEAPSGAPPSSLVPTSYYVEQDFCITWAKSKKDR